MNLFEVAREITNRLTNIFLRDRAEYLSQRKPLGEVIRRYYGCYYPALALFEVTGFFQEEALIELEGMAVVGADDADE